VVIKIFSRWPGIGVYVHWSWFIVAIYSVQFRTHEYSSMIWTCWNISRCSQRADAEFGHQPPAVGRGKP